ncbi:MAG: HAMP domain-containing sensor histidine kinase [Agathobacter sp.]|nr:HAMP domain-containing sensor histidine kinase [uncultured Agathobacter sp.]MCI7112510.1 HAMP domain-containing histidine kinase [Lachnobacterium sp.]MDY6155580.1 HAMP domain-containing sensor histidine kinase [Agathobacter sp.]
MKKYSAGKKLSVVAIHQMFMIFLTTGIYASGYCMKHDIKNGLGVYTFLAIVGMVGSFVTLSYMANTSGRRSEDDYTIYYRKIDKIYSDIFLLMFMLFIIGIVKVISGVKSQNFEFASLLITVGTLTYILDLGFIVFYTSIVRRIKGNILFTHSLIYKIWEILLQFVCGNRFHTQKTREIMKIQQALELISTGALDTKLDVSEFHGQEKEVAEAVNHIRDGLMESVNESLKNEKLKADLITNVSHDIKTPLTSIVNYVDLLKRENLGNENARNYIRILDEKSQRLKQLTEDLVETSKITSGNVKLDMQKIDMVELLYQTGGEFNERFEARNLTIVTKIPNKSMYIYADGRQLYRSLENLYTNAAKYALENTRVYVELSNNDNKAVFTIKNVSKNELDIVSDGKVDLTERFVRGEKSRTTEGSGLGLSIAKNLTTLMGGKFEINVDGDLFIATIEYEMI